MKGCRLLDEKMGGIASFIFILSLSSTILASWSDNDLSEAQKEKLRSFVTTTMGCRDAVGMSLALVRRGETVFAEGFGHRDLENDLPMAADTRINVGSLSKMITTTVAAEAVSNGFISWDMPLKEVLGSRFRMPDDFSTEFGSLRDLFAHKVGVLSYWGVSNAALNISREEFVMRFQHFDVHNDFRRRFNYGQYQYVVGAHAVEKVTGELWEDAVTRLFSDLGMTNAMPSARMVEEDWNNTAFSYRKVDADYLVNPEIDQKQFIDDIGPAVGIFASANDMAQWIKFHLAEGKTGDGTRLIDPSTMRDLHSPTITFGRGSPKIQPPRFPVDDVQFAYGMGWNVGQYRGYEKYHHSGSYSSYSCRLTLVPEADLGVWSCVNSPGGFRGSRANHALNMYALDVLLDLGKCAPVREPGSCTSNCVDDSECLQERTCCFNCCGHDCLVPVDSWLNETTTCSFPDPWASAGDSDMTEADVWGDPDQDIPIALPCKPTLSPFRRARRTVRSTRTPSDFAGSYGHPAFGIFTVYADEESGNLRYRYGALLKGELLPTEEPDEFRMTLDYPLSYQMVFYPQYRSGFPFYFSIVDQGVDSIAVPYLEFGKPPVFERDLTPSPFP